VRILFVYNFLTHGGVEAVINSRVKALKRLDNSLNIGVLFLYKYAETRVIFGDDTYITDDYKEILNIVKRYDLISVIDTPKVFNLLDSTYKPVIVEVHTPYKENRAYIQKQLPFNTKKILTPSISFKKIVEKEIRDKGLEVDYLYNPLDYTYFEHGEKGPGLNIALQKFCPILWVGRLDDLKDWKRALSIFSKLMKKISVRNFELFIIGKHNNVGEAINAFKKYGIMQQTRFLPSVDFNLIPKVYREVALHGGVYLSTSRGESFGMTIAESMASGLPCVLNKLEVLEEISDGRAVYFETDQEALNMIIKLMEDVEFRLNMVRDFKDTVQRYHPDNIAKTLYDKFKQVL
jgi:glycosyltransferase involved in cell wall biosynthesis